LRQLDRQIGSQFYERMALSQNKAAMLEKAANSGAGDLVTPEEAIKDPFVVEFLADRRGIGSGPGGFPPNSREVSSGFLATNLHILAPLALNGGRSLFAENIGVGAEYRS
jgi:hypothetical protein